MDYRNQWSKAESRFDNYTLTLDAAEPNLPGAGGIGIIVQSDFDGIGHIQTTSATLALSVKVNMAENFLTMFGINAAFVQRTINWNDLTFSDQIDPILGIRNPTSLYNTTSLDNSMSYPDFGAGFLLKYCEKTDQIENIIGSLSVSVQHLFQPDISFYENNSKLPLKLVVIGDVLLDNESGNNSRYGKKENKFKINPGFMFEIQGKMSNFSMGLNAYKSFIYTGIWFRNQSFTMTQMKELVMMIGVNIPFGNQSRIKLKYSYDYILSDIRQVAGATNEISLIYELDGFSFFGGPKNKSNNRFGNQGKSCMDCAAF
jgi:type IX secretion system PorP/SprF family membrane protein